MNIFHLYITVKPLVPSLQHDYEILVFNQQTAGCAMFAKLAEYLHLQYFLNCNV